MQAKPFDLPIPLAKGLMSLLPTRPFAKGVEILMRRMEHRHPRLFRNLSRLEQAVVHIEPSDMPHEFVLRFGGGGKTTLSVDEFLTSPPTAHIKGTTEALLDMLEGREDGDMLFFNRRLIVEGPTETVVGLRNTLDREGLHVMDDIASLFGPFARPVAKAAELADKVTTRLKLRLQRGHAALHENDALKAEVSALKDRLGRLEKDVA
jgi:predicted lipid carrier protein YhbT